MPDKALKKMKNLVEISAMVTESTDFFEIKDRIVEKMLEVVHPTKACVNLFYNNDYEHAYLVCSATLKYIPTLFEEPPKDQREKGVKLDFDTYPDYIHEAVEKNEIIYVENIKKDDRAKKELELADSEGYIGRIVFPLTVEGESVGFLTCFLSEDDYITEQDVDFIKQIASLMSLSIEITRKNYSTRDLIEKLRKSMRANNDALIRLYKSKDIYSYLDQLSKKACTVTGSMQSLLVIYDIGEDGSKNVSKLSMYDEMGVIADINPLVEYIDSVSEKHQFKNNINSIEELGFSIGIYSYCYSKVESEGKGGLIICVNSPKYVEDDVDTLRMFLSQLFVGLELFEYSEEGLKHEILENELNIINKQQRLIMNKSSQPISDNRYLFYMHKPAKVIGGDVYLAERTKDNKVNFMIADVMGHGIVANYIVAEMKGAFKVLSSMYTSPKEILTSLNSMLYDEFDKMGVFATAIAGTYDPEKETLKLANAGHYLPIIVKDDETVAQLDVSQRDIPIGIMEDTTYVNIRFDVSQYPLIVFFTDGILELKNRDKEEYGRERLEYFLAKNYKNDRAVFIEDLKNELRGYCDDSFDDDILLVGLLKIDCKGEHNKEI